MMKIDKVTIILLTLISLSCLLVFMEPYDAKSAEEGGETIYVPKDFKTIKEALENAKEGDKIYIDGGKYDEPNGLLLRKGIEIHGAKKAATKIILGSIGMTLLGGENVIRDITFEIKSGKLYLYCADNVTIQNCIIYGSGNNKRGLSIIKSENVEIINCTIANFGRAIFLRYPPSRVMIKNCIISNNKQYGIFISTEKEAKGPRTDLFGKPIQDLKKGGGEIKVESEYNDIWGSVRNYYGMEAGKHDISKDPKFVDVSKGDFHLQPASPCIDTGDPDSKYNDPDTSRSDMGALPYGVKKE